MPGHTPSGGLVVRDDGRRRRAEQVGQREPQRQERQRERDGREQGREQHGRGECRQARTPARGERRTQGAAVRTRAPRVAAGTAYPARTSGAIMRLVAAGEGRRREPVRRLTSSGAILPTKCISAAPRSLLLASACPRSSAACSSREVVDVIAVRPCPASRG